MREKFNHWTQKASGLLHTIQRSTTIAQCLKYSTITAQLGNDKSELGSDKLQLGSDKHWFD